MPRLLPITVQVAIIDELRKDPDVSRRALCRRYNVSRRAVDRLADRMEVQEKCQVKRNKKQDGLLLDNRIFYNGSGEIDYKLVRQYAEASARLGGRLDDIPDKSIEIDLSQLDDEAIDRYLMAKAYHDYRDSHPENPKCATRDSQKEPLSTLPQDHCVTSNSHGFWLFDVDRVI